MLHEVHIRVFLTRNVEGETKMVNWSILDSHNFQVKFLKERLRDERELRRASAARDSNRGLHDRLVDRSGIKWWDGGVDPHGSRFRAKW